MNKNLKLRLAGIGKLLTKEKSMMITGGSGEGSGNCPPTDSWRLCSCSGLPGRCVTRPTTYPTCACPEEGGCVIELTPQCF